MIELRDHKGHVLYGYWVSVGNWSATVSNEGTIDYPDADGSNAEWEIDGCETCEEAAKKKKVLDTL